MTQPLHMDNSTMAALAACDTRALLRYGHGWTSQEESFALQCGTAVHEALETYFKTGDRKQALKRFRAVYQEWAEANVPPVNEAATNWVGRYSFDNVRDILKTWLRRHPLEQEMYTVYPDLVEIGFSFPLDDETIFYGRYDAIVEEKQTGNFYVLDHKTTGQLTSDWAHTFKMSTQITGYTWAAMQLIGKPVAGAIINGIQISKLPDPIPNKDGTIRKCRTHGIPIDECRLTHVGESLAITQRTEQQIAQWKRGAQRLAKRWRYLLKQYPTPESVSDANQQGMFAGACRYCDFRSYCEVGRPADKLSQMLKHAPWKPFNPEEVKK